MNGGMNEMDRHDAPVLVDSVRLRTLTEAVLEAVGFRSSDAAAVAEVLVEADLRGVDSHGMTRLHGYLEMIDAGHVNPRPAVTVERESGSTVLLDGDSGIGIIAAKQAMDRAISLSAESGIACVSLRNVSHTGLVGWYTMRAARQGLIGIAMNNGPCMTPAFGGLDPVAATNPISIAAPSGGPHPIVLDMATTTVAAGKIRLAQKLGQPIPADWGLDRDGQPCTDPAEVIDNGFYQWAGGYKGFGLATMIEILTGVLSGGLFGQDVPTLVDYGKDPLISNGFYAAIDVERFLPLEDFCARVDRLVEQVRATEPIDASQPVMVAGDKELACREIRLKQGIPLSHQVADELDGLLDRFQLSQVARLRSGS
jgi:ureidoglycolate dehydrogenase (NAD+)